jgi:DNA-binding NarL/FixJ family response regulator
MSTDWKERNTEPKGESRRARGAAGYQPHRPRSTDATRITAVLLDRDHRWLDVAEHVLNRLEIRVVGRSVLAQRALGLVAEHKPNLLVADIEMGDPGIDGIACLRQARAYVPRLRTIVLSARDDRGTIVAAFAAGASAYVFKRSHPDDLASAIRQLFEHSIFFARDRLLMTQDLQGRSPLTRRELEILELVARGKSNAETAKALSVTEQTVKFHLSNIYRKLGVSNRTAAGHWAHANLLRGEMR